MVLLFNSTTCLALEKWFGEVEGHFERYIYIFLGYFTVKGWIMMGFGAAWPRVVGQQRPTAFLTLRVNRNGPSRVHLAQGEENVTAGQLIGIWTRWVHQVGGSVMHWTHRRLTRALLWVIARAAWPTARWSLTFTGELAIVFAAAFVSADHTLDVLVLISGRSACAGASTLHAHGPRAGGGRLLEISRISSGATSRTGADAASARSRVHNEGCDVLGSGRDKTRGSRCRRCSRYMMMMMMVTSEHDRRLSPGPWGRRDKRHAPREPELQRGQDAAAAASSAGRFQRGWMKRGWLEAVTGRRRRLFDDEHNDDTSGASGASKGYTRDTRERPFRKRLLRVRSAERTWTSCLDTVHGQHGRGEPADWTQPDGWSLTRRRSAFPSRVHPLSTPAPGGRYGNRRPPRLPLARAQTLDSSRSFALPDSPSSLRGHQARPPRAARAHSVIDKRNERTFRVSSRTLPRDETGNLVEARPPEPKVTAPRTRLPANQGTR